MNGEPISKPQLPPFFEMLETSQRDIIKGLWNMDNLSIFDKIHNIDLISNKMPLEAKREYRKWRFLMDRSRMPSFYDFQNDDIKKMITATFEKYTDLEEFARTIMSIKPMLNNPDEFDKWVKDEEIEFKKPPIQEAMKEKSTSQPIAKTATDPTRNNLSVKTITSETNKNPNICDAIAIDIGTSKCRISICKDKYIQIVEHESSRSVPSCVAYSEQGEWLVGRITENYAVCLQNVIYDIRWLLGKTNGEINRVQDKKRYFFKRSENLSDNGRATFDMIVPGKETKIVDAEEIFAKLLEPLFTTVYKNFQRPTTIAITVPIKSTQDYKNSVEDCAKSAMSSSTATQNIEIIDEPIAVAAAYAPKLNIHSKGDLALVFCMGAGYLQIAAYFIQEKIHQEKVSHWTDWVINKISAIEPIAKNFAGDDIDRLIFDKMMEKLTDQNGGSTPNLSERAERRLKIACEKMKCALSFAPHTRIDVDSLYRNDDNQDHDLVEVIQKDEIVEYYHSAIHQYLKIVAETYRDLKPKFILLAGGSTRLPVITEYLTREFPGSTICNFLNVDEVAATGAAAIVSKTVTMAEKFINYKEVIGIIKEQEKEEEERRNPPSTSTLAARSNQAAELTQTARISTLAPISTQTVSSTAAARPTPADDTPILNKSDDQDNKLSETPHTSQDNQSKHRDVSYFQSEKSVSPTGSCSSDSRDKRHKNGRSISEADEDMRSKENGHDEDSKMDQSSQQFAEINPPTDGNNVTKTAESTDSNNDRNMQSLLLSDGYTPFKTEGADPMKSKIQGQYSQSSSGITNQMGYRERRANVADSVSQSQSLKNNSYDRPRSPTNCLSLNSGKIDHNSQDQKPMPSASTMGSKEFDNTYASSTSSNPVNTGNQYQPNQYNSAMPTSSNSGSNSFGNAGQRMHDDQSVKYHEWRRSDKGAIFIDLDLNGLKRGLNSYLIDPVELEGICRLTMYIPSTSWWNKSRTYSMASGEFRAVREVQVFLDLKVSGNYTCQIALIGVDSNNYEIIRHIYVPYDEPLNCWRKSSICLELTNH